MVYYQSACWKKFEFVSPSAEVFSKTKTVIDSVRRDTHDVFLIKNYSTVVEYVVVVLVQYCMCRVQTQYSSTRVVLVLYCTYSFLHSSTTILVQVSWRYDTYLGVVL
jgi:hypothetical protein